VRLVRHGPDSADVSGRILYLSAHSSTVKSSGGWKFRRQAANGWHSLAKALNFLLEIVAIVVICIEKPALAFTNKLLVPFRAVFMIS